MPPPDVTTLAEVAWIVKQESDRVLNRLDTLQQHVYILLESVEHLKKQMLSARTGGDGAGIQRAPDNLPTK
jgi:hypothetical protein